MCRAGEQQINQGKQTWHSPFKWHWLKLLNNRRGAEQHEKCFSNGKLKAMAENVKKKLRNINVYLIPFARYQTASPSLALGLAVIFLSDGREFICFHVLCWHGAIYQDSGPKWQFFGLTSQMQNYWNLNGLSKPWLNNDKIMATEYVNRSSAIGVRLQVHWPMVSCEVHRPCGKSFDVTSHWRTHPMSELLMAILPSSCP